jgi:hypothetical protein
LSSWHKVYWRRVNIPRFRYSIFFSGAIYVGLASRDERVLRV